MEKILKTPIRKSFSNRTSEQFFYILTLICLAGFLVLPNICLADDFGDIDLREMGKYLELPAGDAQKLMDTLRQAFTTEGISQWTSGEKSDEEITAAIILLKLVGAQALNHLLVEAPLEIGWKIIKNATKIARVLLAKDISVILDELEKESVKKAVAYGMRALLQNEIRVTPGVIKFKYFIYKREKKEVDFQYVMIYKSERNTNRAIVEIEFYMPHSLEPPDPQQYRGITGLTVPSLQRNLPPFIVELNGRVEKGDFDEYYWIDEQGNRFIEGPPPREPVRPIIKVDFSGPVPDLGIRPLSFWERNVLKPIQTTIKEVEIIITKASGGSSKIVENLSKIPQTVSNIWDKIKSTVSNLNPFGAEVGQVFSPSKNVTSHLEQPSQSEQADQSSQVTELNQTDEQKQIVGEQSQQPEPKQLTLAELQEMLDDLAEKIDIFSRQVSELVEAKKQQTEKEIKEIEEDEEEIKELEKKEVVVCSVNINTASKEELQKITGVGPVIAQRIIEARPFSSVYDLKRVSGIGEITLQGIIGQSCAYVVGDIGLGSGGSASPSLSVTYPKILISEIQIEGQTVKDEFIELYNPNSQSVDLTGWSLKKKTSGGSESNLVSSAKFSGIIPSGSYFLIVPQPNDDGSPNYRGSALPDIYYSGKTYSIAGNNTVLLYDPDDNLIDKVGFGFAQDFETAPAENPLASKSLGRKWSTTTENYIDTDNNQNDFEIQAPTPKAQNQSLEFQSETPPLAIAINEIAWMGTAASSTDEWIELYNNTTSTIDLAGWTLSATDDTPSIAFSISNSTTTIPALGFYLLERTNDQTVSDISADQIYTGTLENEGEKLELRDGNGRLIDSLDCSSGWFAGSSSPDYISMERINPRLSGEDSTNWANNNPEIKRNGLDAGQNLINGTPKSQNSVYQSLPPEAVADLTIDSQNSFGNKVVLTWSTSTDPDTPSEDLSYQIYYLKENLNEDNLANASTSSTTATTITISDLDYNSTYYFGIKTFDDWNYSSLATATPYQTATLATIASGFSANDLNPDNMKNNGRKIARASDGDLYVVYSREGKIFLAGSSDQGKNWTEIGITPIEELEQINPSIAIDSQNNLHFVWQGKATTSAPYQIRYRKYNGNSFSDIKDLTNDSEDQKSPVIVVDSQNNLHLVWIGGMVGLGRDNPYYYHNLYYLMGSQTDNQINWGEKEIVRNGELRISILSFALAIDSQDNFHLVWRETASSDYGSVGYIQYLKRTNQGWGEIRELGHDDLQNDFPSLAIDSQDNLHIVWYRTYFNESRSEIKYLKYTASINFWGEIETLDRNEFTGQWVIASPSIALDSQGHLYVIWKRWNEKISQIEYSNSWKEVKNLGLGSQDSFAFTNLLWSYYPLISNKKTNQPETGYAFIFYEGTDLKFYASQDLAWE